MESSRENVQVSCRIRPPNQMEMDNGSTRCMTLEGSATAKIGDDSGRPQSFTLDHIFDQGTSQKDVYTLTAGGLIADVFAGYNTTIFAYGQTGSGKTHTMMGVPGSEQAGIIPRLVHDIFKGIDDADPNIEFTVKVSYVEIYNERLRDLLEPAKVNLKIREGNRGVWIEDVTEKYVSNNDQVMTILAMGSENRAMASTDMNAESSRSHSVMIVTLGQHNKANGSKKGSKLILVDLAGSEKVAKTGAQGQTLKEAQNINKSLSALGNVINALTSGKSKHIPYRDSKLTKLLSDSLGGNSKTCLIITVSAMSYNASETLSTLRFGARAKEIKNKPRVNAEKSVDEYKALLADAERQIRDQRTLIRALEHDVSQLKACLGAVDPKHLKLPMPTLTAGQVAQELATRSVAEAAAASGMSDLVPAPQNGILNAFTTPTRNAAGAGAGATSPTTPATPATKGQGSADSDDDGDDAFDRMSSPNTGSGDSDNTPNKDRADKKQARVSSNGGKDGAAASSSSSGATGAAPDGSAMLRTMDAAEAQALHVLNHQLRRKLEELEKLNLDLQEQLNDKSEDVKEGKESKAASGGTATAPANSAAARKEEQAERARDEATEALQQQIATLTAQLDVALKKQALTDKEHSLSVKRMGDEKRELELKLQSPALNPPLTPAGTSSSSLSNSTPTPASKSSALATSRPNPALSSSSPDSSSSNLSASIVLPGAPGYTDLSGLLQKPDVSDHDLVAALQNKCDQYVNLQIAHQTRKEHLVVVEKALDEANNTQKSQQVQSQTRIRMLEGKLRTAEDLCEKLLESGLYWREQRRKERERANNIVVPIQGGGKAGATGSQGKKATSSAPGKPRASTGSSAPVPVIRPKANQGNSMDIFF